MLDTIRSDIQRAVLSRGFLAGVLGMVVVIALSSVESLLTAFANSPQLPTGYHIQIVMSGLLSDTVVLAVPILCALPFTPAFVDDIQSGFIKQFLPRTGINAYIRGKLLACAISGGLVLFIGVLLAYIASTIVLTPMEATFDGEVIAASFAPLLEKAALFFCSGMFWSLVGFTLASVTKSRYMAYAAPFIVYYILIIVYERYFNAFYYLYPKEWLNPSHFWVLGNWGLALLLSGLTIGISMVFTIFAKGKLSNG
jgi:uncharacterized membrane protein